eukprot:CAMPEP_0176107856 /NCGR_PEP_ID=MMETSP0120_2-20121206/54134_1 /TAXON_ID=160619 /ORGANISM="Kryptoperidinium foliaceum, Strain CCMP 1326" /LENGTH=221 /DNA_ID=CAMNT_0017442001 /DNA_START=60 /DNA_END=724 /DNA_ORIENTATION=+
MSTVSRFLAFLVASSVFQCATCYDSGYSSSYSSSERYDTESDTSVSLYLIVVLVIGLVNALGTCAAFVKAHDLRRKTLAAARRGETVQPPEGCCLLCCCGPAAVYYWEGVSPNCLITQFVFAYYALCCWEKSPLPMENGVMVTVPPSAPVVQALAVPGQPPALVGHPVQVANVLGPPGAGSKAAKVGADCRGVADEAGGVVREGSKSLEMRQGSELIPGVQ